MTDEQETKKCSGCKCVLLLSYFSKTRRGTLFKTCDGCRDRYKCGECGNKFTSKWILDTHIKTVHENLCDFVCGQCNKDFSTQGSLKNHIEHIHNGKKIKCDQCNAEYSSNGALQKHIKTIHNGIKDFACPECDYKCSEKGNLKQHIKLIHERIKDVICEECNAKFSFNTTLRRHIKNVHSKLKDFGCSECNYRCTSNSYLRRHMKICTGVDNCSSGEFRIKEVLSKMKIEYQHDSTFELKGDKNCYLRWDFIINTDETKLFIEYDGRQHFEPQRFGGISKERAQENFERCQIHDALKNKFCEDNNYKLLRIPYTKYGEIEDLICEFMIENASWGYESEKNEED